MCLASGGGGSVWRACGSADVQVGVRARGLVDKWVHGGSSGACTRFLPICIGRQAPLPQLHHVHPCPPRPPAAPKRKSVRCRSPPASASSHSPAARPAALPTPAQHRGGGSGAGRGARQLGRGWASPFQLHLPRSANSSPLPQRHHSPHLILNAIPGLLPHLCLPPPARTPALAAA